MLPHQRTITLALALFASVAQTVRPSQGAQAARPFGTQGELSGAGALGSLLQQADEARQQAAAEAVSEENRLLHGVDEEVVPEIQHIISDIKRLEAGEVRDLPEGRPVSLQAMSSEEWPSFDEMTGKLDDRVAAAMHQRAGALVQQRDTPPKPPAPKEAAAGPILARGAIQHQQPASPDAVVAPKAVPDAVVAPKAVPCNDAVAEVQAAINCSIPPACTKYPPHNTVVEIQLGTQRVLEKCFEFHNACQASAHKFLEIKAMRKLLLAKIQMMKQQVQSENKQFHERIIRLVEKNQTIHMLSDGVKQMNATAKSLQGSEVQFPSNDTHSATGEPKLNNEADDSTANAFH